ncbi:MAG: phosphodiester glycosidase family protein [Bacteroidota bacterium]
MGDSINVLLDDLLALLTRFLNMPIWFQLLLYIAFTIGLWLFAFWILRLMKRPLDIQTKRWLFVSTSVIVVLITGAAVIDYKNHLIEIEKQLDQPKFIDVMADSAGEQNVLTFASLLDSTKSEGTGADETTAYLYNSDGIEIVQYKMKDPIITAYIAAIDLTKYEVVLDTAISVKELTSTFSKRFDADIAVNGEAGTTPGKTAPLGQWIGSYVVNGKVILNEDSKNRPFVYFDKEMNAYYSPENDVVKSFTDKMYNAIWGRFDLIMDGKLAISPRDATQKNPYPRTIVGMDKAGKKMYLMVVDGRKPTHSLGMTMKQCGEYLLKVGCYHAMACDQGGSSVMYSRTLGVFTRPADGAERVTYSHLGFRRKK